ncbi:hypothetical protein [uncultured Thomasclavelia sp.]|uniref:hypothetical protein n=1 Tax=uncultured Thomasclavelia sp. TaxID=3025759 RepID=UPI0025CD4B9A|nr:hypothetical protein [uncultured Thomasclavelia sp.]
MDKIKKLWKEISIFGIILVVFIGLIVYRKIVYVEYTTISQDKLVDKVEADDSFVVVIGNDDDTTTQSYQATMTQFVENHRGEKLYYVDVSDDDDYANWLEEDLGITNSTVPQTIVYEDGEVKTSRTGAITYYRLTQMYE